MYIGISIQSVWVKKVRNQSSINGPSEVVNSPIAFISVTFIFRGFIPPMISTVFLSVSFIIPYFSSFSMVF